MTENIPYRCDDPAKQCQRCGWFTLELVLCTCCKAPRADMRPGILSVPPHFTCGLWKGKP